ncbi:hypothetical protein MRX96_034647 [Rhipicephalus microplus]
MVAPFRSHCCRSRSGATRFDTFVTQSKLSNSAVLESAPLTLTSIVIAMPQTLYEPTPGALRRRSCRIGTEPDSGFSETHDGAEHQRHNESSKIHLQSCEWYPQDSEHVLPSGPLAHHLPSGLLAKHLL